MVQGECYTADGQPTAARAEVGQALAAAKEVQRQREEERKRKVAAREAKRKLNMEPSMNMARPLGQVPPQKMSTGLEL